jgi:citrate/tricarballylate utilization protein
LRETEAVQESRRLLQICNACRYCEGYCAVFPAMELRREFTSGDLSYLANLCHDCRGCYYACQYAPPHEWAVNLPRAFAQVRAESYAEYAWPHPLGGAFRANGTFVSLATAAGIAVVMALTSALRGSAFSAADDAPGAFYRVIPGAVMTGVALTVFAFALLALAMGLRNFWRDTGGGPVAQARPLGAALVDVLTLRNLGGGGHGCNDRDAGFSQARRYSHHLMFYGFLLCFASTCTAAVYEHVLGLLAPYPVLSLPVLLGTAGGIGMMAGTAGLVWIRSARDSRPAARDMQGADRGLLMLLFLAAATGLLLLALRDTAAMGMLLALHLGVILAFFVALPYSKFVHGIYRSAALLRNAAERQTPANPAAD